METLVIVWMNLCIANLYNSTVLHFIPTYILPIFKLYIFYPCFNYFSGFPYQIQKTYKISKFLHKVEYWIILIGPKILKSSDYYNKDIIKCSYNEVLLDTHHEVALCQTLRGDGAEHPGFVAALLGYLRALTRQLPVLRGAQLGRDQLHGPTWRHCFTSLPYNAQISDTSLLCDVIASVARNARRWRWRGGLPLPLSREKLTSPRACRLFTAPTRSWWSTPRPAAASRLSTPPSAFSTSPRSDSTTPVSAMLEPCEAWKRPDVTSRLPSRDVKKGENSVFLFNFYAIFISCI